jgi:hypothetical protein
MPVSEQDKAALSKIRGRAAAQIADPASKQKFIAAQGESERKGDIDKDFEHLNREAEDTEATQGANSAAGAKSTDTSGKLPSYKHGTDYVPKTGPAMLHKGEKVVPKEENVAAKPKHNPSLYRAMHHLNKGGLLRALGVPEDQDIPKEKIEAAKNSTNAHVAHMANFAHTMGKFKK